MTASLKLIHSEARLEMYRQAEMETIEQRITRKQSEVEALRLKRDQLNREIQNKLTSIDDDRYRLRLLDTKKVTPEIPPLEEGPEE
jgi:hypothetical protein